MPQDVNVPGIGRMDRRWVWAIAAGGAGIVGYAWWKRSQSSGGEVIDPGTGEPVTGGIGDPLAYENPNPQTSIDTTGGSISTNVQWTARVLELLTWYEPGYLGQILGKYLAKQKLTVQEAAVIREVWAFAGKPPEGPDNFTIISGSTPTTPPSDSLPTHTTLPDIRPATRKPPILTRR